MACSKGQHVLAWAVVYVNMWVCGCDVWMCTCIGKHAWMRVVGIHVCTNDQKECPVSDTWSCNHIKMHEKWVLETNYQECLHSYSSSLDLVFSPSFLFSVFSGCAHSDLRYGVSSLSKQIHAGAVIPYTLLHLECAKRCGQLQVCTTIYCTSR